MTATPDYLTPPDDDTLGLLQIGADSCWTGSFHRFLEPSRSHAWIAWLRARVRHSAADCRVWRTATVGWISSTRQESSVAFRCEIDRLVGHRYGCEEPSIAEPCSVRVMQRVLPNYLSIYQVRDYQNDHKAFARDVLRFEIALEGVKFLRSLEYAPPDAALTASSVPTAITTTSVAVTAITTPTLAAAVAAAPAAPVTVYTAALTSASITSTATTVAPPMTVAAASVSASAAAANAAAATAAAAAAATSRAGARSLYRARQATSGARVSAWPRTTSLQRHGGGGDVGD